MRKFTFLILLIAWWNTYSQNDSIQSHSLVKTVKFAVSDSIFFHHTSTNPGFFKVSFVQPVDTTLYSVDFLKSKLALKPSFFNQFPKADSLVVQFKTFPDFLTKTYTEYDEAKIFPNLDSREIIVFENQKNQLKGKPLEGLQTQGNLIRGITIGNNQDAVLNSTLDLKIEGKLSSKVRLNARINDTNLPIQENGYSQELKDIDRIYMELLGPNWDLKAGNIILQDSVHYFLNFTKKVQGVSLGIKTSNVDIHSSGALVKGRYVFYQFQGKEANQGPYKLQGENGELYIFIIKGSERVYINGVLQTPGENEDYVMDYNTGEITFTPTNPITSDMRIITEYQYSDRNYTRFVTHNNATYHTEKFQFGASIYHEGDMKNQTLEIELSDEQKQLLANSENSDGKIYVTNAVETEYDVNKILYKKATNGNGEIFVHSNDPNEVLYQVSFTYFGHKQGDYQIQEYLAHGKIMQYVGENQGDYKAVIPLTAPSSQQIIAINSNYTPNDQTNISVELAYGNKDNNLFSNIGNDKNKAPAVKVDYNQTLWDKKWKALLNVQFDYLNQNFESIEKTYRVEFNRDWNLLLKKGNQSLFQSNFELKNPEKGSFYYKFESLQFTQNYSGNRHGLGMDLQLNKWKIHQWNNLLTSNDHSFQTNFVRHETSIKYSRKKWWMDTEILFESNKIRSKIDLSYFQNTFQIVEEKTTFGIGDSTKVNLKTGLQFIQNDSVRYNQLKRVNNSGTWFLQSQLIKKENTNLQFYINYRNLEFTSVENSGQKMNSLNSKITFSHQIPSKILSFQTNYQNTSGQVACQDYNYMETEAGHGFYAWIDYNGNGLKELDEFEIAQFPDQAKYLRFSSPNITYLPTQESKIEQNIVWNPSKWEKTTRLKKFLANWYNQLNIMAQNSKKRTDNSLNLNPFDFDNTAVLSHQFNLRNQLIFNRGKAHYTTSYIFGNSNQKIWQSFGSIGQRMTFHQLSFQHLIAQQWQIGLEAEKSVNVSNNESFLNRNFKINTKIFNPNITYLFNKSHWIKSALEWSNKRNEMDEMEQLILKKLSIKYQLTTKKETLFSLDFNLLNNDFTGNPNSAIGYQILEGLQAGNNVTWNVLWTKKLNAFLYLNLNYNGRSNELSKTIHNGNVQLRANF